MADCWNADPALRPSFESILKRISRIAIKYNLPLPGPSGKIALPSYSVRKFSVAYVIHPCPQTASLRRYNRVRVRVVRVV
jgi:hypothetical protein